MKLSFLLITLAIAVSTGSAQQATHTTFTPEQLAKHLGLAGGNWSVSFGEKLYCGFIVTEISRDGDISKTYDWSSDSSKNHKFHFMHHIESTDSRRGNASHEVEFSSVQEGEWEQDGKNDSARWKVSGGGGMGYITQLPSNVGIRQNFRSNGVKIKPDSPEIMYSWTSEETKREFRVEVIFTKDTAEAEKQQGGTAQPATAQPATAPE
jgi:hypothetical protein